MALGENILTAIRHKKGVLIIGDRESVWFLRLDREGRPEIHRLMGYWPELTELSERQ